MTVPETSAGTMTAAVQRRYGPPETLAVAQIPIPTPAKSEVLVRVHAAAVTPADSAFRQGKLWADRMMSGLRCPKHVLGSELAGEIVQLGPDVEDLAVGDQVFGSTGPTRSPSERTDEESDRGGHLLRGTGKRHSTRDRPARA